MTANLLREASEFTYHEPEVRKCIYRLINSFRRKYGGEVEDYESVANVAYCETYKRFNRHKGAAFTTLLWWRVRGALMDEIKSRAAYSQFVPREAVDLGKIATHDRASPLSLLGEDATLLVEMLVDQPGIYPQYILDDMIYLLRDVGWEADRVRRAIAEILEAIQ